MSTTLGANPYSGDVYIFRSKRRDRLKIVAWDGSDMVLMTTDLNPYCITLLASLEGFGLAFALVKRGDAINELAKVPEMPQEVFEICLHHHEKYDGSGYPHGLRGPAIPYLARLVAICDVYDALTTVRPYKCAWTKTEAIETLRDTKGHFDPKLLTAFVSQMIGGSPGV